MCKSRVLSLLSGIALISVTTAAHATITYTSDPNIADFTSGILEYATFSDYSVLHSTDPGTPTGTFTPTSSELATTGYRVYNGSLTGAGLSTSPTGSNWFLATFADGRTSNIRVFDSIDHTRTPYDAYQYQIAGSNDGKTWTSLFNATEDQPHGPAAAYTLETWTGTAPSTVNNVLTGGGGSYGTVGYEADFQFGTAYKYYAIGVSAVGLATQNREMELSGIGAITLVPEPSTWAMMLVGFAGIGFAGYRRTRKGAADRVAA